MKLVTVTCVMDQQAMILQAESIHKFLSPCTHYVIVNEINPDLVQWRKLLASYYVTHKLILLRFTEYEGSGWHTQQTFKLIVGEHIDDDYLILDSKNFFIKPCQLSEWEGRYGDGTIRNLHDKEDFIAASFRYSEKLNLPPLTRCLNMGTPFVISNRVIMRTTNYNGLVRWFNDQQDILNSEFVLYSYLLGDELPVTDTIKWHKSWWKEDIINIDNCPDHIKVLGVHRDIVDKTLINEFIDKLGLCNRL